MNKRAELQVFHSLSGNVFENLALEETLLSRAVPGREILFLYENNPAVVTGRFQNPWRECRTGLARREGVPVCRRISGGGTVVHGPGNLNFAVIRAEKNPQKEDNLKRIIKAASDLGINLEINSRFDILLPDNSGKAGKVSGSAFRQTARGSLHHGTLLINANMRQLKMLLRQPRRYMETRSVASTPSEVANLSSVMPGLTAAAFKKALTERWLSDAGESGSPAVEISAEWAADDPVFREAFKRLSSPEWIWEKTPVFREVFFDLPSLGMDPAGYPEGRTLQVQVKGGKIEELQFGAHGFKSEDSELPLSSAGRSGMREGLPEHCPLRKLKGLPYHGPDILAAAENAGGFAAYLKALGSRIDGEGEPEFKE